MTKSLLGLKWTAGVNIQNVGYDNSTNQLLKYTAINTLGPTPAAIQIKYSSDFNYNKYGAFFQLGKKHLIID